ncbi:MAG: hypothetical protein AB7F59_05640 [Bdellovibrionales bacterium]
MKFLLAASIFIFSFSAQADQFRPVDLGRIKAKLNSVCGDFWCNGGDYTYEFTRVEWFEQAHRLTLSVQMAHIETSKAKPQQCLIYSVKSMAQVFDEKGDFLESFLNLIDSCVDTLEANQ